MTKKSQTLLALLATLAAGAIGIFHYATNSGLPPDAADEARLSPMRGESDLRDHPASGRRQAAPPPSRSPEFTVTVLDAASGGAPWSPRRGPITVSFGDLEHRLDQENFDPHDNAYNLPPIEAGRASTIHVTSPAMHVVSVQPRANGLTVSVKRSSEIVMALEPPPPSAMLEVLSVTLESTVSGHIVESPIKASPTIIGGLKEGEEYVARLRGAPTEVVRYDAGSAAAPGYLVMQLTYTPYIHICSGDRLDGWVGSPSTHRLSAFAVPMQSGHAWVPIVELEANSRPVYGWGADWTSKQFVNIDETMVGQSINIPTKEHLGYTINVINGCSPIGMTVTYIREDESEVLREYPRRLIDPPCAHASSTVIKACNITAPCKLLVRCSRGAIGIAIPEGPREIDVTFPPLITKPSPRKSLILDWVEQYGMPSAYRVVVEQEVIGIPNHWVGIWDMHFHKPNVSQLRKSDFVFHIMEGTHHRLRLLDRNDNVIKKVPLF